MTFNYFCYAFLDGLYDPQFTEDKQCTGYLQLKKMLKEGITPASHEEVKRWQENPTQEELWNAPDIKYLTFLHVLTRKVVINNWSSILKLEISENENCELKSIYEILKNSSKEKKILEDQIEILERDKNIELRAKNELQNKYDALKKNFDLNVFYEQNS